QHHEIAAADGRQVAAPALRCDDEGGLVVGRQLDAVALTDVIRAAVLVAQIVRVSFRAEDPRIIELDAQDWIGARLLAEVVVDDRVTAANQKVADGKELLTAE